MKVARRPGGASMIVLTLVIAVFILFVVGLFAFELNRVEVARAQLRSATEAAALAAVTTLASQQSTNTMTAHIAARDTALNTFRQNEVMGVQFDGLDPDDPGIPPALQAPSNPFNPPINKEASLFMEFLDPNSVPPNQVVGMGDDRGKAIRCFGTFHYLAAFGAFVGVGDTYLRTMSTGGVPDLDVVLCFDISGSIDDTTPVSLVRRYRKTGSQAAFTGDSNLGLSLTVPSGGTAVRYFIARDPDGSNAGNGNTGKANGTIYDLADPSPTGTSLNAVAPQGLEQINAGGLAFSAAMRNTPNTGGQPGTNVNDDRLFTDLVVNLDGNKVFTGGTWGGLQFPNVAVLVEASRGNLNNLNDFQNSGAQLAFQQLGINIQPNPNYQTAYTTQAYQCLKPINDAKLAAQQFYTLMNNNTKGHFSLVTFGTNIGSSSTSTWGPHDTIATNYGGDTSTPYPNPMVPLNSAPTNTGYNTCYSAVPALVATESTNINGSLNQAFTELTTHQRQNAKRAIVLFTDGQPTVGGDPRGGVTTQCLNAGIPIYCIGLAQNDAIVPGEVDLLNDGGPGTNYSYTNQLGQPSNYTATANGIAKLTSNGSKFYLVTNSATLGLIFGNIARSLCALVK